MRLFLLWTILVFLRVTASSPNPSPTPETIEQRSWRWSPSGECRRLLGGDTSQLTFNFNGDSRPKVHDIVETFRACGVVALEGLLGDSFTQDVHDEIESLLSPFLESRQRIRDTLKQNMLSHGNLRVLWNQNETLRKEYLFNTGNIYKERDDGRIDVTLPWRDPFNSMDLLFPDPVHRIGRKLLGAKFELKSSHVIYALPANLGGGSTSRVEQHWHRDTGLLFTSEEEEGDDGFHLTDVHNRSSGVHLPPYAINAFIPLIDMDELHGPTEFTLGSHMWGDVWVEDEAAETPLVDHSFHCKRGTIILSDYRTVHRGTVNYSQEPRPIVMLIFGRDWWTDVVNYGMNDYGGMNAARTLQRNHDHEGKLDLATRRAHLEARRHRNAYRAPAEHSDDSCGQSDLTDEIDDELRSVMYWGFTSLWQEGLASELRQEYANRNTPRVSPVSDH